jgi:hypothetical protein
MIGTQISRFGSSRRIEIARQEPRKLSRLRRSKRNARSQHTHTLKRATSKDAKFAAIKEAGAQAGTQTKFNRCPRRRLCTSKKERLAAVLEKHRLKKLVMRASRRAIDWQEGRS